MWAFYAARGPPGTPGEVAKRRLFISGQISCSPFLSFVSFVNQTTQGVAFLQLAAAAGHPGSHGCAGKCRYNFVL